MFVVVVCRLGGLADASGWSRCLSFGAGFLDDSWVGSTRADVHSPFVTKQVDPRNGRVCTFLENEEMRLSLRSANMAKDWGEENSTT